MKKKKQKGVNITVSPKAHEKMSKQVFNSKTIKSLREQVNVINNLPKEE